MCTELITTHLLSITLKGPAVNLPLSLSTFHQLHLHSTYILPLETENPSSRILWVYTEVLWRKLPVGILIKYPNHLSRLHSKELYVQHLYLISQLESSQDPYFGHLYPQSCLSFITCWRWLCWSLLCCVVVYVRHIRCLGGLKGSPTFLPLEVVIKGWGLCPLCVKGIPAWRGCGVTLLIIWLTANG